jgi:hypothetical protein
MSESDNEVLPLPAGMKPLPMPGGKKRSHHPTGQSWVDYQMQKVHDHQKGVTMELKP